MLIRFTSIILLILLFWSCEEVVDLNVDFDPGVVVVSEIAPNRDLKVRLSRSRPILSQSPTEYIVASEVTITNRGDGEITELFLQEPVKDTLNPGLEESPFYFTGVPNVIDGSNSYELNVKVDGEQPISAITTVPNKVDILSINILDFAENDDPRVDNQYDVNFNLAFNHDAAVAENYHLVFEFRYILPVEIESDTFYFYITQIPIINDLSTSIPYTFDFENGVLIEETEISEGIHRIEADLSVEYEPDLSPFAPELWVELRNTNDAYHNYHFNLSRQNSQRDSILSQAILVPSNINNGLGIFSGYNFDVQSVRLVE